MCLFSNDCKDSHCYEEIKKTSTRLYIFSDDLDDASVGKMNEIRIIMYTKIYDITNVPFMLVCVVL